MIDSSFAAFLPYLPYLKWIVLGCGLLYILAVFGLSLIAARLHDSQGWMSWFPVINLILVCRLAGTNVLWALPAVIPVINIFIFGYLGALMARRLGTSRLLGSLFGAPVLGAFVPLLLAASGTPLPVPEGHKARPMLVPALIDGAVAVVFVVVAIFAFKTADRLTQAQVPDTNTVAAILPAPVAGTLSLFPIDTATGNPALPTNVSTVTFAAAGSAANPFQETQMQQSQLPPWIEVESLSATADSAVSAVYRTSGQGAGVNVVSLNLRESQQGFAPPTSAQLTELGPETELSGVELQSTDGTTYRGYRVSSPDSTYYMLQALEATAAILITANDHESAEVADRLAANVGNGEGLLQAEEYRTVFYGLPQAPAGTSMIFSESLTESDIASYVAEFDRNLGELNEADRAEIEAELGGADVEGLVNLARSALPSVLSYGAYASPDEEHIYMAGVAGYASASKSWTVLQTIYSFRFLLDLMPAGEATIAIHEVEFGDRTGYALDFNNGIQNSGGILLRDESLLVAFGSVGQTTAELHPWVKAFVNSH